MVPFQLEIEKKNLICNEREQVSDGFGPVSMVLSGMYNRNFWVR